MVTAGAACAGHCEERVEIDGTIDGEPLATAGWDAQAVWLDGTLWDFDPTKVVIGGLALLLEDPTGEDSARFTYLSTPDAGLGVVRGDDQLLVYVFEARDKLSVGDAIPLSSMAAVNVAREQADEEAEAEAWRDLLDEMRDDPNPSALAVWLTEPPDVDPLFSPASVGATAGEVRITEAVDRLDGTAISTFMQDSGGLLSNLRMSYEGSITFGTGHVDMIVTCEGE